VEAFVSKIQHEEHKDHEIYSTGEGSSCVGQNGLANPVVFSTSTKDFVTFVSFVIFVLNSSFSRQQRVRGLLTVFRRFACSQEVEGPFSDRHHAHYTWACVDAQRFAHPSHVL
jgi:hypothetical protein